MSPIHCGICGLRVSDTAMALGNTEIVGGVLIHKLPCQADFRLKHGRDWTAEDQLNDVGVRVAPIGRVYPQTA